MKVIFSYALMDIYYYIYIYMHMYIYVCVCACECKVEASQQPCNYVKN